MNQTIYEVRTDCADCIACFTTEALAVQFASRYGKLCYVEPMTLYDAVTLTYKEAVIFKDGTGRMAGDITYTPVWPWELADSYPIIDGPRPTANPNHPAGSLVVGFCDINPDPRLLIFKGLIEEAKARQLNG